MPDPRRVITVAGARPNFMKVAPLQRELAKRRDCFETRLVHTGQHYDAGLSQVFFDELEIAPPEVTLEVGSKSHAQQTAAIMSRFETVLLDWPCDLVIVVGDVNSTVACALVAAKMGVAVAHVEAGLRSFDRSMPEEINRVLTDHLADYLFTTEPSANQNLCREGIPAERIRFVGNVMIDTLLAHRERATKLGTPAKYGVKGREYGLLTLHRPSNVDHPQTFERLMTAIGRIADDVPLLFPVHPRTRPTLQGSPVTASLVARKRLHLLDPLGYHDFIGLMAESAVVLTDSGGAQEETTAMGVPCLTLRDTTERPVTVTHGTNRVVGSNPDRILAAWRDVAGLRAPRACPPLWDGRAAVRIADALAAELRTVRGSDPTGAESCIGPHAFASGAPDGSPSTA
jgi:UDP-N-acetylglucosamine 2-epimerase (non-hydrolysing)